MKKYSRILAFVFITLMLSACHEPAKNESWYLLHPQVLQKDILACQAETIKDNSQCEMITRAAVKMSEIVNQQQAEPEKFGQSIMSAQQTLQKLDAARILLQDKL